MRVRFGIGVLLALLVASCSGGGSQPASNQGGGGPTGGGGNAAFVTTLVASSLEVNPNDVVVLRATTSATVPSFVWSAQGGQILAQQDGVENGRPFSIAWWKAPSTSGAIYTLRVTVNSPQGTDTVSVLVQVNPTTGTFFGAWPSYHNNAESTGLSTPSVIAPSTLNLVWKRSLQGSSRSSPAIITETDTSDGVSGALYVGDAGGGFLALNADSGAQLWVKTLDSEVATSPVVAAGKVFVATLNGTVYAFDAKTGTDLWSFQTGSAVTSTPAYSNGLILVATQGGTVYALRTQEVILTKTERIWWQKPLTGNHFGASVAISEPVIGFEDPRKGIVAVASQEGNVIALRLSDGATLWSKAVGSAILNKPVVFTYGAQRLIGVGTEDGRIELLDSDTGAPFQNQDPFFKIDNPVASALVHTGSALFFTSRDNHLYELNLVNGLVELNVLVGATIRCTITPAVGNVAGSSSPNVYYSCFEILVSGFGQSTKSIRGIFLRVGSEPATSPPRVLSSYDTGYLQVPTLPLQPPDSLVSAPAVYNGRVYFAGLDGAVYALGPAITTPVTPNNWPMKRFTPNNQAYFAPGPGRGLLTPRWTFPTGARLTASPIVANNTLYVGAYDGGLYAIRASDGMLIWRFQTDGEIRATPVFNNNHVALSALDAYIYYLRANGDRSTDEARILQHEARHTNVIQMDDGNGMITPVLPPFDTADFVLPRDPDGSQNTTLVDATRSTTGYVDNGLSNVFWMALRAHLTTTTTIMSDGSASSTTTVEDRGPEFINLDNLQSAQIPDLADCLWTSSTTYDSTTNTIYVGCLENYDPRNGGFSNVPQIVALDVNSRTRRWARRLVGSTSFVVGTPAVANGIVFTGTADGNLYFLDAGAGTNLLLNNATPLGFLGGVRGSIAVVPDGTGGSGRFFFGADNG
ncbi:MAG: PQQ-binding-like beta-propeller repeat protein, partial [bacterium]